MFSRIEHNWSCHSSQHENVNEQMLTRTAPLDWNAHERSLESSSACNNNQKGWQSFDNRKNTLFREQSVLQSKRLGKLPVGHSSHLATSLGWTCVHTVHACRTVGHGHHTNQVAVARTCRECLRKGMYCACTEHVQAAISTLKSLYTFDRLLASRSSCCCVQYLAKQVPSMVSYFLLTWRL